MWAEFSAVRMKKRITSNLCVQVRIGSLPVIEGSRDVRFPPLLAVYGAEPDVRFGAPVPLDRTAWMGAKKKQRAERGTTALDERGTDAAIRVRTAIGTRPVAAMLHSRWPMP